MRTNAFKEAVGFLSRNQPTHNPSRVEGLREGGCNRWRMGKGLRLGAALAASIKWDRAIFYVGQLHTMADPWA